MTTETIHTCSYSCERPGCIRAQRDELVAKVEALRAEVEAWRELSDHVHAGACKAIWPDRYVDERIRDVAAALKRAERLAEALKEAEEAMRFAHASCATFPQEPQHVQNAAWRRIVSAITKARAVLEQEEGK